MRRIFKTYFAPTYTSSIRNFYQTNTYITRVSHDYEGKEEMFTGIEAFGVGQAYEIENGLGKYIKSKYMGIIENMGIIEAYYDENKSEFIISSIQSIIGENNLDDPYLSTKIKNCLKTQHEDFHYENKLSWTQKIQWLFIQVKKVNVFEHNVLYKQKEIQDIYTDFSEKGDIINSDITKRYFKMYGDIFFDTEKKIFIKGDNQIIIKDDNEKRLIDFLVKNSPNTLEKEDLIKYLFSNIIKIRYENKNSNIDFNYMNNFYLLPLKRKIIDKYPSYLGIDKDLFISKILISPKNKGYSIKGTFVTEI